MFLKTNSFLKLLFDDGESFKKPSGNASQLLHFRPLDLVSPVLLAAELFHGPQLIVDRNKSSDAPDEKHGGEKSGQNDEQPTEDSRHRVCRFRFADKICFHLFGCVAIRSG